MSVCMYICVCVCIYIYIYTLMHTYTHTYIQAKAAFDKYDADGSGQLSAMELIDMIEDLGMCVCAYMCMYVCVCVMFVNVCACV